MAGVFGRGPWGWVVLAPIWIPLLVKMKLIEPIEYKVKDLKREVEKK